MMHKMAFTGRQNFFQPLKLLNNSKRMKSLFLPHSPDYLDSQWKELQKRNIPAKVTTLSQGTILKGLDCYFEEELVEGAPPLYLDKTKFSDNEISNFIQKSKDLYARMVNFVVKEDTPCIEGTTETGLSVYYVNRKNITFQSVSSIPAAFQLDEESIIENVNSPKI